MTITHNQIIEALSNLCPDEVWTFSGDDYNDIVWLTDGQKPTLEEVKKEIAAIPNRLKSAEEAKAKAKLAAEGKLAALGLTTDDLRALGL